MMIGTVIPANAECESRPVWDFSFIASVSDSVLSVYGSLETIKTLLDEQFDSVNNRYNQADCFNGVFNFYVDSIQVFSGNPYTQANSAHPDQDYQITFDFYNVSRGNWLNPPANGILILRKGSEEDAFFNEFILGLLTHELAHSRGAIDLYALAVLDYYNEVNDSWYVPGASIMMDIKYMVWDDYTVNLINSHEDDILEPEDLYLNAYFPRKMRIRVVDLDGIPIENAELNFYAHTWYDFALAADPIRTDFSDSVGMCRFGSDLFVTINSVNPMALQHHITNTNIMVLAEWEGRKNHIWLPLDKIQTPYFVNPDTTLILDLTLPVLRSDGAPVPDKFVLMQNYPNPFNGETNIEFYLLKAGEVKLDIINILGQSVDEIHNGWLDPGKYTFQYEGHALGSGVYFYRLQNGDDISVRKMLLLK